MNLTIYLYFLAAFLCAMGVGGVLFPRIILISKRKRILDRPNGRKVHVSKIPRLGGFAFYPAILVSYWVMRGLFSMFDFNLSGLTIEEMLFFFAGTTIIYYIGMADDIVGLPYRTKFLYQFLSAALLVLPLNYLANWQGIFGVHATPFWIGIPFTVLLIVALINSYNLIDGVDGLCAGLSIFSIAVLSWLCVQMGSVYLALLGVCSLGVLIVFFVFNVFGRRMKIFMGDSGSLLLGYLVAFLALELIVGMQQHRTPDYVNVVSILGVVFVPLADMSRVFIQRLLHGTSPFKPDKRHIHHKLLQLGLSHLQCTLLLILIQALFAIANFWMATRVNVNIALLIDFAAIALLILFLNWRISCREARWL